MKSTYIIKKIIDSQIAVITLNRPEKRNALNTALLKNLQEAMKELNADPAIRVIIIKGAGKLFCAGLDLAEAADRSMSVQSAEFLSETFRIIFESPKVTISAVHGAAIAGGAGLMSACDMTIAAEGTKIGYPETQKGLVAGLILTFLMRQVNQRDLNELLLLGELIDTDKAMEIRLINRVTTESLLTDEAISMARQVLKGAPEATRKTKEIIREMYPSPFAEDITFSLSIHEEARNSDEAKEGIAAFLEHRLPKWDPNKKN